MAGQVSGHSGAHQSKSPKHPHNLPRIELTNNGAFNAAQNLREKAMRGLVKLKTMLSGTTIGAHASLKLFHSLVKPVGVTIWLRIMGRGLPKLQKQTELYGFIIKTHM